MNIIHVYTRQQAIADGVILPIQEYLASHEHGELLLTLLSKINTTFKRDFELGELVITANAAHELLHMSFSTSRSSLHLLAIKQETGESSARRTERKTGGHSNTDIESFPSTAFVSR